LASSVQTPAPPVGVEAPFKNKKEVKKTVILVVAHVGIVLTDVSEDRIASIFRVEEKKKKIRERGTSLSRCRLDISLLAPAHAGTSLADFLLFSCTLKMEAIRSSEMSVNTISTRCHISEDCFFS
jgi:hypothetical protein